MQQVALGWLVYRLTSSAFLLGLVGFAGQIPSLFLGIVNAFDVPARQNGASYAAVLAALVAIRVPPRPVSEGPRGSPWRSLREGVAYVSALSSVRSLLLLMGVVSLAGPTRC